MFVSKWAVCAAVLLVSLHHGSEARSLCVDDTTIAEFATHLLREVSVRRPALRRFRLDAFDPMPLGTYTIKNGDLVVENVNAMLSGLSTAKLSKINWDYRNNMTYFRLHGNLTFASDFSSAGTFMYLPMATSGKYTAYACDVEAEVTFRFKTVICDGEKFMEIYDVKVSPKFRMLQFNVKSNDGCSAADEMRNAALNYNWRQCAAPGPAQTLDIASQKMTMTMNKLFSVVPLVELLKYL